jgi:hypothetical protein
MEAGLRQPPTVVAYSREDLRALPVPATAYVKPAIGTASSSVRRVQSGAELAAVAAGMDQELFDHGVLLQEAVEGPLAMLLAVFSHGRLTAWHAVMKMREGVRGAAAAKQAIDLPGACEDVARLGTRLCWHGPLALDAVLTDDGPIYIDVNPRLVEPAAAEHAGADLIAALLACDSASSPPRSGRAGTRTHQVLLALLGAAEHGGSRRAVLTELLHAAARRGCYRASAEELTPIRGDPLTLIPLAAISAALLVNPRLWRLFAGDAVAHYSLTGRGWRQLVEVSAETQPAGIDPA